MATQVVRAGDVLGVIRSGLSRLPGRKLAPETVGQHANLLVKWIENSLDTAVYLAFFALPACFLGIYQSILTGFGYEPDAAFPYGTWQFYVDYALREDTARHTTETHGFDTLLRQHTLKLSQLDRMTAWTMAAVQIIHTYNELLRNEWRERVYIDTIRQLTLDAPNASFFAHLYRQWEINRPYGRATNTSQDYPAYRRTKFDEFLEQALQNATPEQRYAWLEEIKRAREQDLPTYQKQMTLLAYLKPGRYGETRHPIPLAKAQIGIIHQGRYYLLPVCEPDSEKPATIETIREQLSAVLVCDPATSPAHLSALALIKRTSLAKLANHLNTTLLDELALLRTAPILLNFDKRPRHLPLSKLRQTERGLGDHAMTLFDTGDTFVFDLSHIFFDGAWGAALAEIMTNEAISWAVYLHNLPQKTADLRNLPQLLTLQFALKDWSQIQKKPRIITEAGAATDAIRINTIHQLRALFKQRTDPLATFTVNDVLVLYRAIHAATYRPNDTLLGLLQTLAQRTATSAAAWAALDAMNNDARINPAVLVPVDASVRAPRHRVHPVIYAVPIESLRLLDLHRHTIQALQHHKHGNGDFATFAEWRTHYMAALAGLGQLFDRLKNYAIEGDSANVGTIKLLAYLPVPLQRLLDKIPELVDVLNDIIKGREVFSNVGQVVPQSTLTRFMTAKDDNEQKTLAWSVITDAQGCMTMTLRDFRPHVALLAAAGHQDIADRIAQDYLDAYARGLNEFVYDLLRIVQTSS